ncbi:MAG: SlyX family protein [Steroidobacteraceae bacterium]
MSDPARLEAVEFKLAHLERAFNEINEVVVRQQREIEQLRAALKQAAVQLESLDTQLGGASATDFEKPPHY